MPLAVGTEIGPYAILAPLGQGGMGAVYLGFDSRLQRRVALKSLTTAPGSGSDVRADVLREARAAARLNHPNIAAVFDVLEADEGAVIVMEYVEGESLAARLARERLSIEQTVAVGRQLAAALASAHAHGVVHRDLKPSNIQITPDGSVKVLDFGVARLLPYAASPDALTTGQFVEHSTGGNPGTPIYMSPEQLLGNTVGPRSDIYSLGVVLFQMATGRRPYPQLDAVGVAVAISAAPAPAADTVDERVPRPLSAAIARALERDPDRRFQSAKELESALVSTEAPTTLGGAHRPDKTILRWWRYAAAAAVVALLAAGIVARWPLLMRTSSGGTAVPTRTAILAIMPTNSPVGDEQAEYLASGIGSIVAENVGAIRGVTVLSENKTRDVLERELGADAVLALTLTAPVARPTLTARLRKPGETEPVWQQTATGDPVSVARTLLDGLSLALDRNALIRRRLDAPERERIRRLPTTSGDALVAYSHGWALLERPDVPGNVDGAVSFLGDAVTADPRFAAAQAALGTALLGKYQKTKDRAVLDRATRAVNEALHLDPDNWHAYYALGNMRQQTGQTEQAIRALQQAITLKPEEDDVHRLLGRVYLRQQRHAEARRELEEAVRILPGNPLNTYYLGTASYQEGKYEQALEAFRRTTELRSTFALGYQMLGTTYYMLGDVQQAIGNYEHAVRIGTVPEAYANLAFAYLVAGRYADAIEAYSKAVEANPNAATTRRDLADALQQAGRLKEARVRYAEAIELARRNLVVNPKDADSVALIALCEARLGHRADAERHVAEAGALAPTSSTILFRSAQVYALLNQRDAALSALRSAIKQGVRPRDPGEAIELVSLKGTPEYQAVVKERPRGIANR